MDISVVIPLYNKEQLVINCIRSVLFQKMPPKEIIIVNDGSTDNSYYKIVDYIDQQDCKLNIKIINIQNSGVSIARNIGVENAQADHIAFLDSDDEWDSDYLFEMTMLMEQYPDAGMYSCNHKINKENLGKFVAKCPMELNYKGLVNFFNLSQRYSVVNSSKVIVKRNLFMSIGGFPANIRYGEDLYVWIRMALLSDVAFINKCMVTINQFSDESRTSRFNDVLFPLLKITSEEYNKNDDLRRYLLILFRNSFFVRIKEGNKRNALKIFLKSYSISPVYTTLLFPFIIVPQKVMKFIFNKYRRR